EHLPALRSAAALLLVDANELLASGGAISAAVQQFKNAFSQFCSTSARFNLLSGHEQQPADLVLLRKTAYAVTLQPERLKAWCGWCRVRNEAVALGLQPLVEDLLMRPGEPVAQTFEVAYARWFAAEIIQAEPDLRYFAPAEEISDTCRQQLAALNQLAARVVRARLCAAIPAKNQAASAAALLQAELQKTRHKTARQLLSEMGRVIDQLAPCMMMSPLSVARYLPAELARFDLVVFDEASQIATVDALGAMARGRQVVVVGDPCQMPPGHLFGRAADEDNLDDAPESILQECLSAGVASHCLSWHYRSQNESLFAFANHRYYAGRLLTCPPAQAGRAVEWRRVNGVYNRGNQLEAEAMVAETLRYLSDPAWVAAGYSLGLVVLNRIQQGLVNDLLDQARRLYPHIEPFFQQKEPVMVKTIATVQGDERDIILLGMTYGPAVPGARVMPMNWGLLNQEGGWRALNVAVTRARRSMLVFTSFDPSMVDLSRSSALAVRDLKHFVEYARYGPLAMAIRSGESSSFEDAVAAALQQKGWQVVPQIGFSRFRVGLGVVHPDHPGDYLAAVECDRACMAADLCQIQPGLLSGQGWKVLRVWPLCWWKDQAGALEDLHLALQVLLAESRLEVADLPGINQDESHAAVSELYPGDLWFARPRDGGRDHGAAGKLAGSGL
ncbi:MAG: AAA domain-containing protein, partial [Iodobacter sp.]